jgi:hypothetical protein
MLLLRALEKFSISFSPKDLNYLADE